MPPTSRDTSCSEHPSRNERNVILHVTNIVQELTQEIRNARRGLKTNSPCAILRWNRKKMMGLDVDGRRKMETL
ncbi:hypothetical protein MRB53_002145 [Persea americana]|uniref:Uncharacterized protein n=1 Tax=Persea americana TaxID=3435 RepID=A0ACC2MTL1_PERAE|nr:hypothetical protein MRB53_002145 [Persea americana]